MKKVCKAIVLLLIISLLLAGCNEASKNDSSTVTKEGNLSVDESLDVIKYSVAKEANASDANGISISLSFGFVDSYENQEALGNKFQSVDIYARSEYASLAHLLKTTDDVYTSAAYEVQQKGELKFSRTETVVLPAVLFSKKSGEIFIHICGENSASDLYEEISCISLAYMKGTNGNIHFARYQYEFAKDLPVGTLYNSLYDELADQGLLIEAHSMCNLLLRSEKSVFDKGDVTLEAFLGVSPMQHDSFVYALNVELMIFSEEDDLTSLPKLEPNEQAPQRYEKREPFPLYSLGHEYDTEILKHLCHIECPNFVPEERFVAEAYKLTIPEEAFIGESGYVFVSISDVTEEEDTTEFINVTLYYMFMDDGMIKLSANPSDILM